MNALDRRNGGSYILPSEAVDPEAGAVLSDPYLFDVRTIGSQDHLGRPCKCCSLPEEDRALLNTMLLSNETFRHTAKQFGLDHTAVYRHFQRHVVPELRRFVADLGLLDVDADRVILDIESTRRNLVQSLRTADNSAKPRLANSQIGASKVLLELAGRLKPVGSAVQVNIGGSAGTRDDLEAVYSLLRERGEHDLIEAIAARLSGEMVDVTPALTEG